MSYASLSSHLRCVYTVCMWGQRSTSSYFLRQNLSLYLKLADSARLVNQLAPGLRLSLQLTSAAATGCATVSGFYVGSEGWTQVHTFVQWALQWLSHLPNPTPETSCCLPASHVESKVPCGRHAVLEFLILCGLFLCRPPNKPHVLAFMTLYSPLSCLVVWLSLAIGTFVRMTNDQCGIVSCTCGEQRKPWVNEVYIHTCFLRKCLTEIIQKKIWDNSENSFKWGYF